MIKGESIMGILGGSLRILKYKTHPTQKRENEQSFQKACLQPKKAYQIMEQLLWCFCEMIVHKTDHIPFCLLIDSFGQHQVVPGRQLPRNMSKSPSKQRLLLAGHLVCYKAIQLWLALSNKKFYACMDLWKTGATLPLHCNCGLVWHSTTYSQTKAWLTVYFANMGESLPNSEVIQIPMILNQKALYQEMVLSLGHDQSISYACFLQMLHEDFSYVHFSKKYYKHHAKAKASPFKYISIITDYTEAIPLPHHHTPPKG
ncbi:hypothetical protein QOT17_008179 [Balamuthia mandrillaris]